MNAKRRSKYCSCLSLVLFTLIVSNLGIAFADLLQPTDITYKGAFRLPAGAAAYGGGAMTFRPDGNGGRGSILISGHGYYDQVGEFAMPDPILSSNYSALPEATELRPFASIGGSVWGDAGCGQCRLNGLGYYTSSGHPAKLCWTRMNWYNVGGNDEDTLACSDLPGTGPNPVGLWHPGPRGDSSWHSNKTGGYIFQIPSSVATRWNNANNTSCVGFHRFGGAFGGSMGPTILCFNPWSSGSLPSGGSTTSITDGATILGGTVVLRYSDYTHDCWTVGDCEFPNYQAPDRWAGATYINVGSKEAILIAGVKGLGSSYYIPGAGWFAPPYELRFLLYNVDELAQVATGQRLPQSVVPYQQITLPAPFGSDPQDYNSFGALAYDSAKQRLYVSQIFVGPNAEPVIHVYDIAGGLSTGTSPVPTVALSASPVSIETGNAATLSWSSTNATSCTASAAWSGTKSTSGTQSTGTLSATSTYSLSCTGAGGSASQSTTVTVTAASTPPSSSGINVSSVSGLQSAIAGLASNQTILLADGTYNLSGTLYLPQNISNITIKGASGNREAVVVKGPGMNNSTVPFGFWLDNVAGVIFQDMTIRDFNQHGIIANGGVDSPVYRNLHIIDIGDQFLKNNPTADRLNGVDNGILENSLLEYTSAAPDTYTNGLDVHRGKNWIVRNNTFKNFWSTAGLAGPAVLIWNGSSDSTVVRNTFINNQRDISLGLDPNMPVDGTTDHARGVIANNVFYKTSTISPDVPIAVFDSPQTKVYYNTVLLNGGYPNAIEYRFARTTGVDIKNNLTDAAIVARDGASASVSNNITTATSGMFASAPTADLHLVSSATTAIDKGVAVSVTDDFDGQARPQGAASDIGADEYTSTSTAPAAPSNLVLQ